MLLSHCRPCQELASFRDKNPQAEAAYNASIVAAQSSKFVNEEGLAAELAGNHFERLNEKERALAMFQQAERCYEAWGSQRKACQMSEKISKIGNISHAISS